jgi:hypothetical protein
MLKDKSPLFLSSPMLPFHAMMPSHKVGGEVDAYCTSCRMELAHTVLAMVGARIARVRCNTCQKDHAFRKSAPGAPSKRPAKAAPLRQKASASTSIPQQLASADASKARNYSPKESFAEGDILNHATFGLGLVQAVRGEKIDVAFKAFAKTLIHQKTKAS